MSFRDLEIKAFYPATADRLNGFYVPLLREAVRYDRMTGYFRSSALSLAAAGISRLLEGDGRMRVIAGAELGEEDRRAITEGAGLATVVEEALAAEELDAEAIVSRHRLETLAYLLREGRLELKIGVPTDHLGRPLSRGESDRYFHSKYGVMTDADGNQVAFIGSDNESASGWQDNHESFSAFTSWMHEVWAHNGEPIRADFERHWRNRVGGEWTIIDVPEAIRERLVAYAPTQAPRAQDPEEGHEADTVSEDALLRFVGAAPRIRNGTGVGHATAGVEPWPHQEAIARRAESTFPRSYLLADEVGLGKTIEIGLMLRELLLAGRIETALLLVPASVSRQWQEELAEKFTLEVPRYDRGRFFDSQGRLLDAGDGPPWSAFPVVIASSHLARRRARREEVLSAGPWDVVVVDEAHHARRRGAKPTDEPNALLRLLQTMRDAGAWKALYLASATPMQMHPHEAWDLIELLGLRGAWARSAADFTAYFEQLRAPFDDRDWTLLSRMASDYFSDPAAKRDVALERKAKDELGVAAARPIVRIGENDLSAVAARGLSGDERAYADEWLRAHTPMQDRVFRTTRDLLRVYKQEGVIGPDVNVPFRRVDDRFVPMTDEEARLYDRIETYISRYYDAYMKGPKAQKPLGFIMTVYRRRLTSSFNAIERSLERRLEGLLEGAHIEGLLDPDDLIAVESSVQLDIDSLDTTTRDFAGEVDELRAFLTELRQRPPDESKMERLHNELRDAFQGPHDTALVFTQYTDTMDYVRDQLRATYGERVACYSGRGGERWDSRQNGWVVVTKEEIKNLFREGREVKVLVGTDSLSEGLNLQTCGKLINYDMPWNFMRVEQRIGRVDRIGGQPEVEISNYFYSGTVEEQIYKGIGEDFEWFQDVVGPAQPVLNQIESAIEDVALERPSDARQQTLNDRVARIRTQMNEARAQAITLGSMDSSPDLSGKPAPAIDLLGLERILTSQSMVADTFNPHPEIEGAYVLALESGDVGVTFNRKVYDDHPDTLRLLTYLSSELAELLRDAGVGSIELDADGLLEGPIGLVGSLEELEETSVRG